MSTTPRFLLHTALYYTCATGLPPLPGSELLEKSVIEGTISRKEARTIDTAQNNINLSDIPRKILEQEVSDYLYKFNTRAKLRNPDAWKKKYEKHESRMSTICIGKAAPNTDGLIKASQSTEDCMQTSARVS